MSALVNFNINKSETTRDHVLDIILNGHLTFNEDVTVTQWKKRQFFQQMVLKSLNSHA